MLHRRAVLAKIILLPAIARQARAEAHMTDARAVSLMKAGGLNLYMRHAITDRGQRDTGRRGDRAGQRNLDARGRAQAAALGEAFRRLGIPLSEVSSSEVFRARDTAEIAFEAVNVRIVDALIADDYTPRDPVADAIEMRRLLNIPPRTGNAMFVGHIIPFGLIMGRSFTQDGFPEGSVALVKPGADRPELLGVVPADALVAAAGLPTPWIR
jgi:phosphohistidine phosphatase SixA